MNLILITPHGRSGSLLVQSLLDSHTELISLPTLSLRYPKWEFSKSKTKELILEFIDLYPDIFDLSSRDNYLGNLNQNIKLLSEGLDPEKYQVSIKKFLENAKIIFEKEWDNFISRKNFFEGFHLTYAKTIGMDITKIKYMVIHLHRIDSGHKNALKDYPNLKFIATSRDPREHWISYEKVYKKIFKRKGLSSYNYFRKLELYKMIYKYKKSIDNLKLVTSKLNYRQTMIVDLNFLHSKGEVLMEQICKWLNINFEVCLFESTFLGLPWYGNAASGKSMNGFDFNKSKFLWPSSLEIKDKKIIETILKNEIISLKYEKIFSCKKNLKYIFFPFEYNFLFLLSNTISELKLNFKQKHKNKINKNFISSNLSNNKFLYPLIVTFIFAKKLTYETYLLLRSKLYFLKSKFNNEIEKKNINAYFLKEFNN